MKVHWTSPDGKRQLVTLEKGDPVPATYLAWWSWTSPVGDIIRDCKAGCWDHSLERTTLVTCAYDNWHSDGKMIREKLMLIPITKTEPEFNKWGEVSP